jgi:hypothetical protein
LSFLNLRNGNFYKYILEKKILQNKDLLFYFIFSSFIILHLYWILSLRILPFIDLPFHLAASTIFRYLNDTNYCFSDYYTIPTMIKSNIFHMVFTSLKIFPDVEFGNKVFYIIYIIIFPLSSLFFVKYIDGNKWFSLLSFLFIYNHNVHWGFTGFTMSVPLIILFILFVIRFYENQNTVNIITLILILLLIFSMHFQNAIFCILILSIAFLHNFKKSARYFINYTIIILPVLILMFLAYTSDTTSPEQNLFPFLISYYKNYYLSSVLDRVKVLAVMDNFYFIQGPYGAVVSVVFVLSFIIPIIICLLKKYKKNYATIVTDKYSYYLYIFILCSLFCYLFLPNIIPGQNIIFERFSVFLMLGLILYCAYCYRRINISKFFKVIIVLVVVFHFIIVSLYYIDFKIETKNFNESLFPDNARCKRLSGIIYTNTFKGRPVYIHFPMYFTIWKKGITTGLIDYRFFVIKRKTDFEKLPYYREWIGDTRDYNNEYKNLEYILLKDGDRLNIEGFNLLNNKDEWFLYENNKLRCDSLLNK